MVKEKKLTERQTFLRSTKFASSCTARKNRFWAQTPEIFNNRTHSTLATPGYHSTTHPASAMGQGEETKVQKFYGRSQDNYSLWRIRIEAAVDGKNNWKQIEQKDCPPDEKRKAAAMIFASLGDTPLRVGSSKAKEQLHLLALLDARYASKRTSSQNAVLTAVYTKMLGPKKDMAKYIYEFARHTLRDGGKVREEDVQGELKSCRWTW